MTDHRLDCPECKPSGLTVHGEKELRAEIERLSTEGATKDAIIDEARRFCEESLNQKAYCNDVYPHELYELIKAFDSVSGILEKTNG